MFRKNKLDTMDKKRLLTQLYDSLSEEGRDQLVEYAEFLVSKYPAPDLEQPSAPPEPIKTVPPEDESVPAAIKRLSRSYPMLDKLKMMNPTSTLMTQYLTRGRPKEEVINDLEELFQKEYNRFLEEFHQKQDVEG